MIVFCEYVVLDEHRDAYLHWLSERAAHGEPMEMETLENTAQPGVFVEIWRVSSPEHAARTEKERRDGRSWQTMKLWIKGGEAGLRIWTFRPVVVND